MKTFQPTPVRSAVICLVSALFQCAPAFAEDAAIKVEAQSAPVVAPLPALSDAIAPNAILSAMERAADWQLANPSSHFATEWTSGVGDSGMMALAGISGNRKYRDAMLQMGEKTNWALGSRRYHADDHVVGQTYAELYLQLREPKMIAPLREQFDFILRNPHEGTMEFKSPGATDRWSWCDALYMGPPTWMRLYAATGDRRYMDLAVSHWWRTSSFLYDKTDHLFFRDSTYLDKTEANGQKVYWGRGNGWVMGGLVRMLQYLPANHPSRARFLQQFTDMSNRIVALQQADGLWRASMLDSASYPLKETSGSSLFAYALSWGVNQGVLDRATFEPAVRKAWTALVASVQNDGKLTHVQPIGASPKSFDNNATEVYGVGAFLLAGSEVYRMAVLEKSKPQVVTVSNPANFQRSEETVEVNLAAGNKSPAVMDERTSRIINSQRIDNKVLFQVELAPGDSAHYLVLPADQLAAVPPADIKTYARFVPERFDDFAWESDRIIHRTYGPTIMTTPKEMLVTAGMDVWVKSVRYPVIDKWYKGAKYHINQGEGLDYYHVGTSSGCGGTAIYDGTKLFPSANFKTWKVLANGPLRSQFELTYDTWDAAGHKVSETKLMSIDAGSNLTRVESTYKSDSAADITAAIGIAQRKGDGVIIKNDSGWMSYWEPEMAPNGHIGCAVVIPGTASAGFADSNNTFLALGKATPGKPFIYYFGAGWSQSGDFPDAKSWENYVSGFAAKLKLPLVVTVK